jgi:hypothetical protein
MEKETQCILDRYNLTKLIVANYYYSAYGIFPVVENLTYQYSQFIDATTLNLASDEFALIQTFVGGGTQNFAFGTLSYDVHVQNNFTGLLLDRVASATGVFMIHVFKYV